MNKPLTIATLCALTVACAPKEPKAPEAPFVVIYEQAEEPLPAPMLSDVDLIGMDTEAEGLMAGMAYGECRGEKHHAKCARAVMHVAYNRFQSGKYGKTMADVIMKPRQFSSLNLGDPNLRKIAYAALVGNEQLDEYRLIAREVLTGADKDPTRGATYYYNPRTSGGKGKAWIEANTVPVRTIGNHQFRKGNQS